MTPVFTILTFLLVQLSSTIGRRFFNTYGTPSRETYLNLPSSDLKTQIIKYLPFLAIQFTT